MNIPVEIHNGTKEIVIQLPNITNQISIPSDPIATFWLPLGLVISTLTLSVITGIGLWRTLKHTKKSNEELTKSNELARMDIIAKLKPNLRLANFPKVLNEPDPLNPAFSFEVHNYGESYVDNLEIYATEYYPIKHHTPFSIEEFVKNPPSLVKIYQSISPLLKDNQTARLEYIPTGNDPNVDVILWIKYEFLDGEKNEVIYCTHYQNWKYVSHNAYPKKMINRIRNNEN